MSLTAHLKNPNSPIAQFIRQSFLQTSNLTKEANRKLRNVNTLRSTVSILPAVYSTLGIAIDYRIRYSFAITPPKHLVAFNGAALLAVKPRESDDDIPFDWDDAIGVGGIPMPFDESGVILDIAEGLYPLKLIKSFFNSFETILHIIQPVGRRLELEAEQLLARYCYVLALFEEVYREGPDGRAKYGPLLASAPKKSIEELLAIPEHAWIEDLCAMSWLFYDQCHYLFSRPYNLNPTFDGSIDVGGADADLIVDGCLIEIKASIDPKIRPVWLWQVAGYILLDYDDKYHIDTAGIYMVRQGLLLTWPIANFLELITGSDNSSLTQLRQEFRTLCKNSRTRQYQK